MGFSRGLLNVVTFGAASRVDKAGDIYQDLVNTHNYFVKEIQKLQNKIPEFLKGEKEWLRFKRKNKRILTELYNHNTKLSENQKQALKILKTDLDLDYELKGYLQVLGDDAASFQDTTLDNTTTTAATLILNIIPGLGTLGANLAANEKIAELKSLTNKVEQEILRIKPIYQKLLKLHNDLELRSKAFLAIQELAATYVLPKKKRFIFF